MNSKKWMIIVLSTLIFNISIVATVNYVVDPFNIFQSNFLKYKMQMNERYVKVDYIEKNHEKYNAYLFGSSRIGVVNPKIIEQYVPNSKFYNFTLSSANLHDDLMHLRYFIKEKYRLNTLYLQIDLDDMNHYGQDESDYLCKLHPHITNESDKMYYVRYLLGFFPLNIRTKIETNIFKKLKKEYWMESGIWTLSESEKQLNENPKKYVKGEKSFHFKPRRTIQYTTGKKSMDALQEIINLCKKNQIKLYIFTAAHNHRKMDTFILKDYNKFLRNISKITSFYDFTGYNSVTKNDENYYEMSHYRPKVGILMAAKIFDDKKIDVPKDFGRFIEKGSMYGSE
jgi:hypothetical protein